MLRMAQNNNMSLKTSATPDAPLEARQTGLEGQFNRANYDAKTTTVSNLKITVISISLKMLVSAVRSQIFVQLGQPKFTAVISAFSDTYL